MGKEKKEHMTSYRPISDKSRFWFHSEYCYTEEELAFREWVITLRAKSGIHPDYLSNPGSWFADNEQALVNHYEHAWFYSDTYKPRQVLTRDDFHVQPIDSQRLQWPALYDLMQNTGDYLLIRNRELSAEHLNQPMNFVLLDVNHILKGLSQNTNIQQVQEQLEALTHYLITIEKNISPLEGSDRLFLANFRRVIDSKIHPHLTHLVESQLLKERLGELLKTIKKLSTDRNRILHFALNINPVNPHPYDFTLEQIADIRAYPTQAAKNCATTSTELMVDAPPVLQLTMEQLKSCPHFHLIAMDERILNHYANAISDLDELDRFQKVVAQIMDLLGQAGEVYTIHQFKEQMLTLLTQIDVFIDESTVPIDAILQENTQAYHKAIQQEQDLTVWKRMFTTEKIKLQNFRKNHDTLSQFPSRSSDLVKTNKVLKGQVNQVISHLSSSQIKDISFAALTGKAQELDKLMGSMHQWVKNQHTKQGKIAPSAPEPLAIASTSVIPQLEAVAALPPSPSLPFALYESSSAWDKALCDANTPNCTTNSCPPDHSANAMFYIGLFSLLPLSIFVLVFFYEWNKEKTSPLSAQGSEKEFNNIKTVVDDLLAQMNCLIPDADDDQADAYELCLEEYKQLCDAADQGSYNCQSLNELHENLQHIEQQLHSLSEEDEYEPALLVI
ncbi:hypothetical protein [Legionella worsleiensis]|uniref:Uncharacterized protein n=1 Tax=Legionella worsleiensis TaxID=45076 RepID=A0A0W1A5V7_9GAMM|nr:hypothetical protein [Legionella worsleiensis]KTD76714.1 hypothetical protein Lwor_1939 [Legionella worsleiensis]STY30496.1 Uncharacterised protein [Legionella worsleiensis]